MNTALTPLSCMSPAASQYQALRDDLRSAMRFGSANEHQREERWAALDAFVLAALAAAAPAVMRRTTRDEKISRPGVYEVPADALIA